MRPSLALVAVATLMWHSSLAAQATQQLPIRRANCDRSSIGSQKVAACSDSISRLATPDSARIGLIEEYLRSGRWDLVLLEMRRIQPRSAAERFAGLDSIVALMARGEVDPARLSIASDGAWASRAGLASLTVSLVEGRVWRALKQDSLALTAFRRAGNSARTDPRPFLELADTYASIGNPTAALSAYNAAASRALSDSLLGAQAWAGMARLSAQAQRPATAVSLWERALRLDPKYLERHPEESKGYNASLGVTRLKGDSLAVQARAARPLLRNP